MRTNNVDRESVVLIKSVFEVRGLNLDRFINTVKKRGIALYDIKKYSNKRLVLAVNFKDCQKFFAIGKELCYNIKKLREKGKGYPLLALYRSLGVLIGAIIIAVSAYTFNDFIFGFTFTGSGSVYHREVKDYLKSQGVTEFSRFSAFSLERLEDGILADNPHLSFASCVKVGNRLVVDLALSQDKVGTLDGKVYEFYSDVDGVVENIKVYRGTAVVEKGQAVKKGELLVNGVAIIKDKEVKINVLACVTILSEFKYEYRSNNDGEEERAVTFAEQALCREPLDEKVIKSQENGEYIYTVTLTYRHVIYAG